MSGWEITAIVGGAAAAGLGVGAYLGVKVIELLIKDALVKD